MKDPQIQHVRPSVATTLARAWELPFYRTHWAGSRLDDALASLDADRFADLPVVRKDHLRRHWDEIMQMDGAVDICCSSGTTGRPVDIPVTGNDETRRVERVRRVLAEMGVGKNSRVLQLFSLNDMFTFGPLAWMAVKAQGGCALRMSVDRVGRILSAIEHLQPEFVVGNPFSLIRLAEAAGENWPAIERLPHVALMGVEATFTSDLTPAPVALELTRLWGLDELFNQYGCSELGPVAFECRQHRGMHVHDDHFFVELVDPESGLPTGLGEPGEVVVTGLETDVGFLPVRYATGDVAAWIDRSQCACGRTSPRLGPILGRLNHQLKVQGQTVFPDFLIDAAYRSRGVDRCAVMAEKSPLGEDVVTVFVVPVDPDRADEATAGVAATLRQLLAVSPVVKVVANEELDELERGASIDSNRVKIPRFFDRREQLVT